MIGKFLTAFAVVMSFSGVVLADSSEKPGELEACLLSQQKSTPEQEFELFYKLQARAPAVMSDATRIQYGKKLDQYGDLRLPAGSGPFPVAIVVHGGNWSAVVNSDYMAPVAELLTKAGFATWNIEYSRIGSGGGWPGSFQSIGAATDFLRELAKKYPLDLDRVMAVGHSSGGHFVLWMLSRQNIRTSSELYSPNPLRLKGALSLDGSPDIEGFGNLPRGKVIIPQLIGSSDPAVISERLKDISPILLLPTGGKSVIVSQDSDRAPLQKEYIKRAKSSGDSAVYDISCPANHFTTTDTENAAAKQKILEYSRQIIE